jgi:hypothetical protein
MGFVSDIFGGGAAKKAAKAQVEGAKLGIGELQRQFDLSRGDLAPWREAGGAAIGQGLAMLQPGYDHTTSPGYDFRFNEGQRAVESGAASKGMLMSGGTLKDLTRFGQGVAADDFNDQFNRTMAVAGGGQQAATSGAQLGAQSAGGIADLYTQMGNARASGYVGQANAIGGGISQLIGLGSMFLSDRRLKTNLERVGEYEDGLGIYEWNWKADPDGMRVRGVIADEVKALRPWAYVENFRNGFDGVNYGALNAH